MSSTAIVLSISRSARSARWARSARSLAFWAVAYVRLVTPALVVTAVGLGFRGDTVVLYAYAVALAMASCPLTLLALAARGGGVSTRGT